MNETEHPLLASAYMEDLELWKYIQQLEKRIDAIDVDEMVRDYGRMDMGFCNPSSYECDAYRKGVQDAIEKIKNL